MTDRLSSSEPFMWLLVALSIHIGVKRQQSRSMRNANTSRYDEEPPDYRALRMYVWLRFASAVLYPLFEGKSAFLHLPGHSIAIIENSVYWTLYLCSSICVFFIIAALLRKSLQPLAGLRNATLIVFKWASGLALLLAATAHLPVFGIHNLKLLLNEVSVSFVLCICAFELSLLTLLVGQVKRLGMCLRSRPVGLAFGLAVLGIMDLATGITANLSEHTQQIVSALDESSYFFVTLLWSFYIWRPEPKRLPHSLSPASRLAKWEDIARRIGMAGKEPEHVPFIATVEGLVDGVLEKFKERAK